MFYDSLTAEQEFDFEMPIKSEYKQITVDTVTNEVKSVRQPRITHRGSYSSKIDITLRDNTLTISGNPSRYNREENLFGINQIDECFKVYNEILSELDLPLLTKCTKVMHLQGEDGTQVKTVSDGAIIKRVDMTTNMSVGKGAEREYIRAVSTLPWRNKKGHLFPNGFGCDWLNKMGNAGSREYLKLYCKYNELNLHAMPKAKREFGINSPEYKYLERVRDYCIEMGVARFENELHRDFLRENNLRYWGLLNEEDFKITHDKFVNIDQKLQVTKMDIEHVNETLLRKGICTTTYSASTTASYFSSWMSGKVFDFSMSAPKLHASRLNKIGIDIRVPFDSSRHSPVIVRKAIIIKPTALVIPQWYKMPAHNLALVA